MRRITPRTCLWPLVGSIAATFTLSIGLTYQSDRHCFAGTCGEWLFPLQARLHVVVWYMWISISIAVLALRAFRPWIRNLGSRSLGIRVVLIGKELRVSGLLLLLWVCSLYGILVGIWWIRLRDYFDERGAGLPGNNIVAAVAMTGHLVDVTMGMVLLPVSRHSALATFFKLSPSTTLTFHMTLACVVFTLVAIHGSLYAAWVALYNEQPNLFRKILPVLNPTYLYDEVWPGNSSALGIWRASLIFTGGVASLIMVAVLFTSFPFIRRRFFNLFYFTHLFIILAVVVICLHASTMFYCVIPGLSMWLLDWSMRLFELREKLDSRLSPLGRGWYILTVPLPRKRLSGCACHSPLAHFYIHHSQSSVREIHPFTTVTHLASQKASTKEGTIWPSTSKSTQWTWKLASLADEEMVGMPPEHSDISIIDPATYSPNDSAVQVPLRMEGPYFTPANPELYKTVVCLVAGTGLSGAIAIASAFKAETGDTTACPTDEGEDSACTVRARRVGRWSRCVVIWTVKEQDFVPMPFFEELSCPGLEFQVHKTGGSHRRLDVGQFLTQLCGKNGVDCWCYISGPRGFITVVEQACGEVEGLTWFAARWD